LALDLSQDAFVKTWRSIKKIDVNRSFFTWYYTILKNTCLNEIRKNSKQPRLLSEIADIDLDELQDFNMDISETVEKEELKKTVWIAISKLKENEQEILMMREFQNLSYSEISEILNCPEGTVMSRLYGARKALKEKVEKYFSKEI